MSKNKTLRGRTSQRNVMLLIAVVLALVIAGVAVTSYQHDHASARSIIGD